MPKINLIRVDSRLIHGQVITKWLKISKAKQILIVDDELAGDSFLSSIYTAAAPKNVPVKIRSVAETIEKMAKDQLSSDELLLLTKDIDTCFRLYKENLKMDKVQIGGIPSSPERETILRAVSLSKEEMEQLSEMNEHNVEIVVHTIPEEGLLNFDQVTEKFSK